MDAVPARGRWRWWLTVAMAPAVAWAWAAAGQGMTVRQPVTDLAWLALLAVAEELVFRGGVQAALLRHPAGRRACAGLSGANLVASAAFALAHVLRHDASQALAVLPVSLLLGLAFEHHGRRLAWPVALHLWFNVCLYLASVLTARPPGA